jgi:DNA polymerase, archaea type
VFHDAGSTRAARGQHAGSTRELRDRPAGGIAPSVNTMDAWRAPPRLRFDPDEWLWGWDRTPGIVSVWATASGHAQVWRRTLERDGVVRERARFRPWLLLASLDDLAHLGPRLCNVAEPSAADCTTFHELEGPGRLRYLVHADDGAALHAAVLHGASRRLGRPIGHVRELGAEAVLSLPPEEQYLVASGRSYFHGLAFDDLLRLQFDLETTGLDPDTDRIFLVALSSTRSKPEILEAHGEDDEAEAELIRRLCERVRALDPDVIENHNLHGFDLPFLARRAERLRVPLALGRTEHVGLSRRPAARGAALGSAATAQTEYARRSRFSLIGRELIDTMDAVRRHDFAARDLPGHGLKAVGRHFGLASPERVTIPGAEVYAVYRRDPERVRRYAMQDVVEAGALARLLGGAAFALARMTPRRYERLADAGAATGVLDPLLVRAYLRSGTALPAHHPGDGTAHSGAALYLFATGVAERVVKADVASLYPSLMREYRIGPSRDRLGVLLTIVDRLVEQRLAAKAAARAAAPLGHERHTQEALSAAMKLVVNSAYGYLGAAGLTRFSDVHAANEVTRRGRALLSQLCRELARRGVTLLEADTDGVYFAVPVHFDEADERRVVAEVDALLPVQVHLEFEGRSAAMLSHEPKNYALLSYDGALTLRGVAFRSRRAEPFGTDFLRRALRRLLAGDVAGVREVYLDVARALRQRSLPTSQLTSQVRLTKTPEDYLASREQRRELPYEALLASGRRHWTRGERIYVYRAQGKRAALHRGPDLELRPTDAPSEDDVGLAGSAATEPRDYDVDYYLRLLRESFAARLARALTPDDYAAVFADPTQLSLFASALATARPILTVLPEAVLQEDRLELGASNG